MNWSYRPFNNEYELLLVPDPLVVAAAGPQASTTPAYYDYVDRRTRATSAPEYRRSMTGRLTPRSAAAPYPHLLDFFESSKSSATGLAVASSTACSPTWACRRGLPTRRFKCSHYLAGSPAAATNWFHTPFNRISRYREPGCINLKTLTSSRRALRRD